MELSSLTAISPLDGRYLENNNSLRTIFSEFSLLKFRLKIEILWLKKLASCYEIKELLPFNNQENYFLDQIINEFNINDAEQIKSIEKITNHDIKAIEYFLKEKISSQPSLKLIKEFVHFACTSEDINNLSYALMLSTARETILLPIWNQIISVITILAEQYKNITILSRTHGQPATPSTMGKEMINVVYRMLRQYQQLQYMKILGKINGTVGNYNAHMAAYPKIDWLKLSKEFVTELGIHWNPYTTQIEPHDYIAEILGCITRFNTIMIDFNRDIWGYISLNYFKQHPISGEIGSSVMPYKINPIDFENSEGNLGLANAIMNHLIEKLPISRWQRDLSDSTLLRNLGVGIGYAFVAYQATLKGIKKLKINQEKIFADLNCSWEVIAEPIQTIMRQYGIEQSYEKLKELTRGKQINEKEIKDFIKNLPISDEIKDYLNQLTPINYIGRASILVDELKTLNII